MENATPHLAPFQSEESNHPTLPQSAHTQLYQGETQAIFKPNQSDTSKPLNGSCPEPRPVNGTPATGSVLNPVSDSDISCSLVPPSTCSKQHGCDRSKPGASVPNGKLSSGVPRKSSLTLSLSRRGSGFVSPIGDTIINRPSGPARKKSHVQFEPPQPDPPSNEPIPGGDCSPPPPPLTSASNGSPSASSSSSSSSSSSDSSLDNLSQIHPPDGGWGWVIVFASFMVNLIADGITFSFGVIFIEFLHYFGEGKSKTAWIGSLFMAIPLLSGPIASFLTDRYGCRKVTILGGILAATGFILSSMTDSINVLLITFGLIAGFGLSLCYVAAVVIVAYYFDENRSFATGLSVCGSGIGTFLFAPLTHYLLKEYGWRGTTLILAGLFLNLCVCGALMRDLAWTRAKAKAQRRHFKKTRRHRQRLFSGEDDAFSQQSTVQSAHQHSGYPSIDELRKLLQQPGYMVSTDEKSGPRELGMSPPSAPQGKESGSRLCSSLVNLPTFVRSGEKVPLEVLEALTHQHHVYSVLINNYPSLLISSRSFSQSGRLNEQSNGVPYCNCLSPSPLCSPKSQSHPTSPLATHSYPAPPLPTHPAQAEQEPMLLTQTTECEPIMSSHQHINILEAKLSPTGVNNSAHWLNKRHTHSHSHTHSAQDQHPRRLPTAYLKDLRVHRHSLTYRGAMLNINRYRLRASSCPDIYRNSMTTIAKEKAEWYAGLWELWYLLSDMLDFSHFKNIKYTLFAISNFLLYFWYDVPYVYLADNAVEAHGTSEEDASYLISMIGILNMFGEIVLGWAGDREWVNANVVYAASMGLCGVVLTMVPLIKSYRSMCGVSGFFGLFVAANYSLTSIILVEITTIERFTNAYGLLLLVQGVANLVGPPLAGWLYDLTNSYDLAFYLSGIFIALSGLLLLIPTGGQEAARPTGNHHQAECAKESTGGQLTAA